MAKPTPYTKKFEAAMMAKPETAAFLNSKSVQVRRELLQHFFTVLLCKKIVSLKMKKG